MVVVEVVVVIVVDVAGIVACIGGRWSNGLSPVIYPWRRGTSKMKRLAPSHNFNQAVDPIITKLMEAAATTVVAVEPLI